MRRALRVFLGGRSATRLLTLTPPPPPARGLPDLHTGVTERACHWQRILNVSDSPSWVAPLQLRHPELDLVLPWRWGGRSGLNSPSRGRGAPRVEPEHHAQTGGGKFHTTAAAPEPVYCAGFLPGGNDLGAPGGSRMTPNAALALCRRLADCTGFTWSGSLDMARAATVWIKKGDGKCTPAVGWHAVHVSPAPGYCAGFIPAGTVMPSLFV